MTDDVFHGEDDLFHPHEPAGAADDAHVYDGAGDDEIGGDGDDGQVIPPGPEGGDGDQHAGKGGGGAARQDHQGKAVQRQLRGQHGRPEEFILGEEQYVQDGGDIGADRP